MIDKVKHLDTQKVLLLLSRDEGPKLDFKLKLNIETEGSKKELAKDICAIANSRGGRGYILFGVEDKTKKLVGINRHEFLEEQIQQIVSTRLDPPVPISVSIANIHGKDIGIITIYNTDQKSHQMRENGAFYTRRGSTTDIMHKEEIASMLQETGLLSYELLPVVRASKMDLDFDKIKKFLIKSGLSSEVDDSILLNSGIISMEKDSSEFHPTCGGILLFGNQPQNFLPHSIIKIINMINNDLPRHFIAKGTILDMLNDSIEFIKNCINEIIDFPIEIMEDLLGKAVIHRDYFDINNSIEIYLGNDKFEITNPGAAGKNEITNRNRYIRRNMWLYLKLLTIDISNRYFHKSINLSKLIKKYGKIKYFNIPSKNIFKVVIKPKLKIKK
ncbi:putative DNA-binding protein [Fonticella tunisiensis]|uniref:Putative DNA-binding protein n=1 Tax=Fonticella tunisiensis TaxID=1096341 RepID=A0A4R7KP86_9CLOT|nr:putative DNA-binding protein [Fonticella tunisiensis]